MRSSLLLVVALCASLAAAEVLFEDRFDGEFLLGPSPHF